MRVSLNLVISYMKSLLPRIRLKENFILLSTDFIACDRLPSLSFLLVICDSGAVTGYGKQGAHGMAC